ncbi:MAG: DUF4293 domain-containing protein [Bacteroidales bacterium]
MIQRIQTLFLAVVVLLAAAMFFLPLAGFISEMEYLRMYLWQIRSETPGSQLSFGFLTVFPLVLLAAGIIVVTLVTIFSYKNRIRQLKLIRLIMFLAMLLIVAVFVLYPNLIMSRLDAEVEFESGAFMPVISLLFLFLANRYITRDEKLVRSVDRLR